MLSSITLPRNNEQAYHRWFLEARSEKEDGSLEQFKKLLTAFAALGNAGAFVAPDADGRNCSMRIVKDEHKGRGSLELLVEAVRCDLRYARPLRNAVFAAGEMLESPTVQFAIAPAVSSPEDIRMKAEVDPAEVEAEHFYPEMSTRLGARIEAPIPPNYSSGRRAWLRTKDELPIELVAELTELTAQWGSVLVAAYPRSEEELRAGRSMILNVQGCQHDEVTFEVTVDKFFAAEAAFSSLLNLLVIRSQRDVPVSEAGFS